MEVGLRLRVGNNGRFFTWAVCSLPRRRVWHTRRRRVTCDAVSDLTPRLRDMQAAHYLKSLTEVPVRDASNAAAPHLYAISNGLAVFALSKRMVREDGQLRDCPTETLPRAEA